MASGVLGDFAGVVEGLPVIIIIIVSGRMTGEFRAKLWAHSARDWAINSPEFGALILMI